MKSRDPRAPEYPWQSPYVYHRNSPMNHIDYLGGGDYLDPESAEAARQEAITTYGEQRVSDVYFNSEINEYGFNIANSEYASAGFQWMENGAITAFKETGIFFDGDLDRFWYIDAQITFEEQMVRAEVIRFVKENYISTKGMIYYEDGVAYDWAEATGQYYVPKMQITYAGVPSSNNGEIPASVDFGLKNLPGVAGFAATAHSNYWVLDEYGKLGNGPTQFRGKSGVSYSYKGRSARGYGGPHIGGKSFAPNKAWIGKTIGKSIAYYSIFDIANQRLNGQIGNTEFIIRELNAGIGFAGLYGAAWSFGFELGWNCRCGPFNYMMGTGYYAK